MLGEDQGAEARLRALGLTLPAPLVLPSTNRTSAVRWGDTLYISGHGAQLLETDAVKTIGKVGAQVTEAEAYQTARALGLKMLATVRRHAGDLDRVKRVIKLTGFINSAPDFTRQNKVLDGASDLMFEVFGPEIGVHARSSLGVAALVGDQPVEIEAIFGLAPG